MTKFKHTWPNLKLNYQYQNKYGNLITTMKFSDNLYSTLYQCTNKFTNKLLGPNQNKKYIYKKEISMNKKCTLVWTGWVWVSLWLLNPGLWMFVIFECTQVSYHPLWERLSILVTDDEGCEVKAAWALDPVCRIAQQKTSLHKTCREN